MTDDLTEVEHVAERIERLERAIDQAIEEMPEENRALVQGLEALRGVTKLTVVTRRPVIKVTACPRTPVIAWPITG